MKGKKKRDRGRKSGESEEKNQGEGHIFKAEIFQIVYLTTCTFKMLQLQGGPLR